MKISGLTNRYDVMKEPNFSVREGDISAYEIDLFALSFKKLIDINLLANK